MIDLEGGTTYFHRLVRYSCDNVKDREGLIAEHGIPPSHPMAEEWPILNLALNKFIRRENPGVIISTQEFTNQILDRDLIPKLEHFEQRPGLHAFFCAIKIKYLKESEIYHKCPMHCHERYDITFANARFLDDTNAGYFRFTKGYSI